MCDNAKQNTIDMLNDLLVSDEAQKKLSNIGEGAKCSYDSITSVEAAYELVESIVCHKE